VTEFILLGLTQNPHMQKVIFVVFLLIYTVSLGGNVLTIVTITTSPLIRCPMYFFLAHLSFIDACCSWADIILLTAMAYDCYVAICKPLYYATIMNRQLCGLLVGVSWLGGFLHAFIQILFIFRLPFCGPNIIDHFMCDLIPLLKLACTDTHTLGFFVASNSGFICLLIFPILVGSYGVILKTLSTQSLEARRKALSTCVSHITAVVIFFVPCIFMYMRPAVTLPIDKAVAVFYTMITPIIYTLRNAQLKTAITKLFSRKAISSEI
uniref:G-protein coupled receptors family 1 profile domain-containing protein n=1 Tax=Sus scrofa TaxID=9823 RepID=A0A4X1SKT0_PIG